MFGVSTKMIVAVVVIVTIMFWAYNRNAFGFGRKALGGAG